LKPKRPAA